jgi:hypothetical protein
MLKLTRDSIKNSNNLKMRPNTRTNGYFETGFYKKLSTLGRTSAKPIIAPRNSKSRKIISTSISQKLNYSIVKTLVESRPAIKTIHAKVELTNVQLKSLQTAFGVTGKYQHFPNFLDVAGIETMALTKTKQRNRVIKETFQLKLIRKPTVSYSNGLRTKNLTDGCYLHFLFEIA